MKKTISIKVILLFFAISCYSQQNNIAGTFLTKNKKMKVEFYQTTKGKYNAKVVWKAKDADKDVNIGDVIIKNLTYNSKLKQYEDGTLTAKGKTLDCMVLFIDTNQMKIFMRNGFIKKEIIWTRV